MFVFGRGSADARHQQVHLVRERDQSSAEKNSGEKQVNWQIDLHTRRVKTLESLLSSNMYIKCMVYEQWEDERNLYTL